MRPRTPVNSKKTLTPSLLAAALLAWSCLSLSPGVAADDQPATLEFTVRATPTGGRPEKVMRQPFYLLRASLAEIETQAREEVPPPDIEAFADGLDVSGELKAWIKREKRASLQGPEFLAALTVDDVMDVPEFRHAYVTRNLIMVGLGFPKRKAKLTDREKNPEKWEASEKRYWEDVRSYLTLHPESKEGMDEHLIEINPAAAWRAREQAYEEDVRRQMLRLIHERHLAARTETDYEGFARIAGLAPGRYWLTNLWTEVRAGDLHLNWELLLELKPGQTFYIELNNANARAPARPRP